MRIGCVLLLFLVIGYVINTVSAADDICRFNDSVNISKGDLPAYFNDQVGCGMQNTSDGAESIIMALAVLFVLIMIYGVFGKK